MGMIPESTIAEIRERTDLVALVQEHVNLKRVGASFKGLCPFHSEKSPSFYVHPERQFFHCFGCQASGDCIAFVTRLEGTPFPEVVRMLADRAGIKIEVVDAVEEERFQKARARTSRLASVMDAVAGYYVKQLKAHPLSQMARDELVRRGLTDKSAEEFRLGYAPHGWDSLAEWLKTKDHDLADAEELGLLVRRKSNDGHYDRFRHRLMFPISDHQGKIIAFSGRALDPPAEEPLSDQSEPGAKYINSPENPLYKKGQVLYGLHEGRVSIRRQSTAMICEGNFDLVALHQAGFDNAVAPMGTALTREQAKLLRRFAGTVILLFDGDRAGYEATWKAVPVLAEAGLNTKVVAMPKGSDPDTYLREHGAENLRTRVDTAPAAIGYLIEESAHRAAGDPSKKAEAIEALGPLLAATAQPTEIDLYIQRIRQKFGISDEGAVRRQLRRGVRSSRSKNRRSTSPKTGERDSGSSRRGETTNDQSRGKTENGINGTGRSRFRELETELVGAALDQPNTFLSRVSESSESSAASPSGGLVEKLQKLLTEPDLSAIFLAATDLVEKTGKLDASALMLNAAQAGVGREGLGWLEQRLAIQKYEAEMAEQVVRDVTPQLWKRKVEEELAQLTVLEREARRAGDDGRADELSKQRTEVKASIKLIKRDADPREWLQQVAKG